MKQICDMKELSTYLKISIPEIRILVRSKRIPYFKIGRLIKFDLVEINKWVETLHELEGKNPLFL